MAPLLVRATIANLDDISIVNLIGPMLLGFLWGYCLYGILVVQMYIYYVHFAKDPIYIKIYAWLMFLLESAFTFFCTVAAWKMFASGWGNVTALSTLHWGWQPLPVMNGILAFMAQSFYVWRILKLTKNLPIAAFIECFALCQLISCTYYGVKVDIVGRFDRVFEQNTAIIIWLASSAACDALITTVIVIVLRRAQTSAYFKQTAHLTTNLIRWTIETGFVTFIMALAELVLWVALAKWNFHYTVFITIGRVYSNALMATLNSRALIFQPEEPVLNTQRMSLEFNRTTGTTTNAFWNDPKTPTSPTIVPDSRSPTVGRKSREEEEEHEMVVLSKLRHSKRDSGVSMSDVEEPNPTV